MKIGVIGGGPSGAITALVLAKLGKDVSLFHTPLAETRRIGESLPPVCNRLLSQLGLLGRLTRDNSLVHFGNVSLWGDSVKATTDFARDPDGNGWHLDRAAFDQMLLDAAGEAGAKIHAGVRARVARSAGEGWSLALTRAGVAEEFQCRWWVDATGRSANMARKLGVVRRKLDQLIAFHCTLESRSASAFTHIEAERDGWWYAAPLPSGRRVVAFLTDLDLGFASSLLTQRLRDTSIIADLVHTDEAGRVFGVDASSGCLEACSGDGWVAVGDAALSFDPLSSQGLYTAMYTGMLAAEALATESPDLTEYCKRVQEIHSVYCQHRSDYYGSELRWADSLFWKRRHR